MHRHILCPAAAASLRLLAATVVLLSLLACSDAPAPPAETGGQLPQLERLPMVEGIDADGDGVRDDIADYIRKTYTDPVQYRAAMQVARAFQLALLTDPHDAIALREASDASNRAIVCAISAFPGDSGRITRSRMLRELESMTTNTKERLQAYLAYNKAQSGSVSTEPEGAACD
jgi:hypothetical protein